MREAVGWSAVLHRDPAWPSAAGSGGSTARQQGVEYYTGYLVEKSLSVDNLFVFIILLSAFAVPRELRQRVLLIGVAGALVLRGIFIALGAQMIASLRVDLPALRRDPARRPRSRSAATPCRTTDHSIDVGSLRSVRLIRRFHPVTDVVRRHAPDASARTAGGRSPRSRSSPSPSSAPTSSSPSTRCRPSTASPATPTSSSRRTPSPCSACARSTSSLEGALGTLVHLGHGLSLILAFIGVKLVLHWAHGVWPGVPEIPTLLSLGVIIGILAVVTVTSLLANRRPRRTRPTPATSRAPLPSRGRRCRPAGRHGPRRAVVRPRPDGVVRPSGRLPRRHVGTRRPEPSAAGCRASARRARGG